MFTNPVEFEKCKCQVRVPSCFQSNRVRASACTSFCSGPQFLFVQILEYTTPRSIIYNKEHCTCDYDQSLYVVITYLEGGEHFTYSSSSFRLAVGLVIDWLHSGDWLKFTEHWRIWNGNQMLRTIIASDWKYFCWCYCIVTPIGKSMWKINITQKLVWGMCMLQISCFLCHLFLQELLLLIPCSSLGISNNSVPLAVRMGWAWNLEWAYHNTPIPSAKVFD